MKERKMSWSRIPWVPLPGVIVLVAALLAAPALAAPAAAGYTGPGPAVMTVAQAKSLRDDAQVTLQGNIIRSLGGKKYLFQDATGTITVEIKTNRWEGLQVGPESRVEIHGELDKDWSSVEVEVERIILAQ